MIDSIWTKNVRLPSYPTLEQDETTDVLIIGGGIAGLLCAYFLQQKGASCLVCEADRVGGGVTSGTTAVLSAQHSTLYQDLYRKFGRTGAKLYLSANLDALEEFRRMEQHFSFDLEERPSMLYTCGDPAVLAKETAVLRELGQEAFFHQTLPLPLEITGAVEFPAQAQMHPIKFLAGLLATGLQIREHSRIQKISGNTAYTALHRIHAKKIIVATHFPIKNSQGMYFAKLYQKQSYVIALENAANYPATYESYSADGFYFRNYKDYLLIGGSDRRTGCGQAGFAEIRRFAHTNYPGSREVAAWVNQDCISLDGVPYIGRYSRSQENLFCVSGFNEWGMTSAMAAAKVLTDLVCGRKNQYAQLFDPSRSMLSPQLFKNIGITMGNFILPTFRRCPHMGCALRWNRAEHVWECPCHGSQFAENGALLQNPSKKDLELP